MHKYVFLSFLFDGLACGLFTAPIGNPGLPSATLGPDSTSFPVQTLAVISDHQGNNSIVDICHFSLEIPKDWKSQVIDSGNQPNSGRPCSGYALTNLNGQLTLIIKPGDRLVEAFQTCPAGTVSVQYTSTFIVRYPDPVSNGFVYSYAPLIAGPNDGHLYMCQTPPALWIAGTLFTVELTKQNNWFDQRDLDIVDGIIESIKVPPYQY